MIPILIVPIITLSALPIDSSISAQYSVELSGCKKCVPMLIRKDGSIKPMTGNEQRRYFGQWLKKQRGETK